MKVIKRDQSKQKYDFAKIESVVFIPEIKAINHGEYIIYISAYSETGTENLIVKNVILKENEIVLNAVSYVWMKII